MLIYTSDRITKDIHLICELRSPNNHSDGKWIVAVEIGTPNCFREAACKGGRFAVEQSRMFISISIGTDTAYSIHCVVAGILRCTN